MSLLIKFNETGQEIGSEDVPLNDGNLQFYIEQYGKERAEGYHAGLSALLKETESILQFSRGSRLAPHTPATIRREFESFYDEQMNFLNTPLAQQIKEHGLGWQRGYLDSVSDFTKQADLILYTHDTNSGYYRNSDSPVRRNVEKYFKEKTTLIKILQPTIKSYNPNPPT